MVPQNTVRKQKHTIPAILELRHFKTFWLEILSVEEKGCLNVYSGKVVFD